MTRPNNLAAALCLALVAGCERTALESTPTENAEFNVERLFSVEGCNVYRFSDGRRVHVVICPGGEARTQTETTTTYPCGKGRTCTTTNHDEVQTKVAR